MQQLVRESPVNSASSPQFQRKLAVEFIDNIEALKKKTSHSKKTSRALFAFFAERINTELAYAQRLATLAKNGKYHVNQIGGVTVNFGYAYSIVDYKNNEEITMQNALNALLDFTIQESEFHRAFAEEMKEKVLKPIHENRNKLTQEKENWMYKIEALNKYLISAQEKLKQEQAKLKLINQEIESAKDKKKKALSSIGIDPNEEIAFQNLPPDIQKLEKLIIEKAKKKKEIADNCDASTMSASQTEEQFKENMKQILERIEQNEILRMTVVKQAFEASNELYTKKLKFKDSLCKIVGRAYTQINPHNDIQAFIMKHSLCATNEEELKGLYKNLREDINAQPKQGMIEGQQVQAKEANNAENDPQKILIEKIKKKMGELKHLRATTGEQKFINGFYPNTSTLKRVNLHADIKCEDTNIISAVLYCVYTMAYTTAKHNQVSVSPFRETIGEQKKTIASESKKEETPPKPSILDEHKRTLFSNKIRASWMIPDSQIEIIENLLKVFEDGSKWKDISLKANGMHSILLYLLQQWQLEILHSNGVHSPARLQFSKGMYTLIWSYVFWEIFRKAHYKDEEFDQESGSIIQILEFNSYMAEATLLTNQHFVEVTLKALLELKKNKKYDLQYPTPVSMLLFEEYVAKELISVEEKGLLVKNFDNMIEEARPLNETLGIDPDWTYGYLIRFIWKKHIGTGNYTKRNELQNNAIKAILSLKTLIEANFPSFYSAGKLKPNEFFLAPSGNNHDFALATSDPLLYSKVEKSGVLFSLIENIGESLYYYKDSFGNCTNKLTAILEIGKLLYSVR